MNPALQTLIELDKVNIEIGRLSDEVAALPKRVAAIETKLADASAAVEAGKRALKDADVAKRKHESDIQDWQQKIRKFREQASSVKNNEQYRALMLEIAFAEKQIGDIEEQILIGMEAVDGLHAQSKAAQAELQADTIEVEKEKEHARSLTAEDEKKLGQLNARRMELRGLVDGSTLANFERVASKRKNAIAEAFDQKCTACNVMVRPQRFNELLSGGELVTCESCGRILYVDPAKHASHAPKKAGGPERAWFYLPGTDPDSTGKFLFFTNSKGNCSLLSFDAGTGRGLEHETRKKTDYQSAFADWLASAHPLHARFVPENSDQYLDQEDLEELQLQARIAPGAVQ
jgi:predicted  nucleic acid-binding Zn-ribbon protein